MRKLVLVVLALFFILSITACGGSDNEEITLHLSFGDRTGTYKGDMVDGVPNGNGKFTTTNADGQEWTYEGEFVDGHFEGEGKTTWFNGSMEIGTYSNDVIVPLSGNEIKKLYTDSSSYLNHCVEFTGKVFQTPEYSDDIIVLQVYEDIENYDNNTIVCIPDEEFEVKNGDYVHIVGRVGEDWEGENMLGATLVLPTVAAQDYEIISYQEALSPTLKELDVNQTIDQKGYSVTVEKVEFAESETRVYVSVTNGGSGNFNLYSFNALLIQNGTQYSEQSNYEANYPEIQTDLRPGVISNGIIAFPGIEQSDFQLILEAYSDNWQENIDDYIFNIAVK